MIIKTNQTNNKYNNAKYMETNKQHAKSILIIQQVKTITKTNNAKL